MKNIPFLLVGILFGITMTKSEAISWFRIIEMFRFESFHMFGIIGVAVVVSAVILFIMKKSGIKTLRDTVVTYVPMKLRPVRHIMAGSIFGLGWALLGACPGPMYVLFGHGYWIMGIVIIGALFGTYSYGVVMNKLPH